MKTQALLRHILIAAFILFLFPSGVAVAGDMKLAAKLKARLQQAESFSAKYLAQSSNNENIEIQIAYREPDHVFISIPAQKTTTIYDGESLYLVDIPTGSAILMNMQPVKRLLEDASRAFEGLEKWIDPAKLHEFQKLYAYPVIGLTKSGLDVAVGFSPILADASWLRRMELDKATIKSGQSVVEIRHGEYLLSLDAEKGRLISMSDESFTSKRKLKLVEFSEAAPDENLFSIKKVGAGNDLEMQKIQPGESVINTVIQRQFQMILRELLKNEAPVWAGLDLQQKKGIAGAVENYWRRVFQSNPELKTKLSALTESKESRELIKMRLNDKNAFDAYKSANKAFGESDLEKEWIKKVGTEFARQILGKALAPIQHGIILDAKAYLRLLEKEEGLSEPEALQMLRMHIDPMENALIETIGMTIYEKIMKVARQIEAQ